MSTGARRSALATAVISSAVAGLIGGGLCGIALSVVAAIEGDSVSSAELGVLLFGLLVGAFVGLVAAFVPAMAVSLVLQRLEATAMALPIGAALGAGFAFVGYGLVNSGVPEDVSKTYAYGIFALAGAIGGGVGGRLLRADRE